jgi:hypothetical protein
LVAFFCRRRIDSDKLYRTHLLDALVDELHHDVSVDKLPRRDAAAGAGGWAFTGRLQHVVQPELDQAAGQFVDLSRAPDARGGKLLVLRGGGCPALVRQLVGRVVGPEFKLRRRPEPGRASRVAVARLRHIVARLHERVNFSNQLPELVRVLVAEGRDVDRVPPKELEHGLLNVFLQRRLLQIFVVFFFMNNNSE